MYLVSCGPQGTKYSCVVSVPVVKGEFQQNRGPQDTLRSQGAKELLVATEVLDTPQNYRQVMGGALRTVIQTWSLRKTWAADEPTAIVCLGFHLHFPPIHFRT
jgi:hypothetical protein